MLSATRSETQGVRVAASPIAWYLIAGRAAQSIATLRICAHLPMIQNIDMTHTPLLAHLAERFVSQRENLATEALTYILTRSRVARVAFIRSFRLAGADLPAELRFRTQAAGPDDAIPDLVGEDESGTVCLIVEAKFWAGLTEAQPCVYLRRLDARANSVLAFVVPERRVDLVWHELLRRCVADHLEVVAKREAVGIRHARVGTSTRLILVHWRAILANMLSDLSSAGEVLLASDLRQLQGLCDREDDEAFLPLSSAELTGNSGRRVIQYSDLVDDLTSRLVDLDVADVHRLRAAAGKGWYGKYLRIHGVGCLLHFSASKWSRNALSPLWLRVVGPNWTTPDAAIGKHVEARAFACSVQTLLAVEGMEIPVFLPTEVGREEVFAHALTQLRQVADWLQEVRVATPDNLIPMVDPIVPTEALVEGVDRPETH